MPRHTLRAALRWAVVLVVAGGAAGCQPAAAPALSDPREILAKTITTTAAIRTMHARLDYESRAPGSNEGGARGQGGFIEGDVDVDAFEVNARGASLDGTGQFGLVIADGTAFSLDSTGRWTQVGAPIVDLRSVLLGGGAGGASPDVVPILGAILADPATRMELVGVEDCAAGRCYRTKRSAVVKLMGLDRIPGGAEAPPAESIPGITFEILSDTATLRLVDGYASASAGGTVVNVRVQVSAPNVPVSIQAPPRNLVNPPGFPVPATPAPVPAVAP